MVCSTIESPVVNELNKAIRMPSVAITPRITSSLQHSNNSSFLVIKFTGQNVTIRDLIKDPHLMTMHSNSSQLMKERLLDTVNLLKVLVEKVKINKSFIAEFDGRFFHNIKFVEKTPYTTGYIEFIIGSDNLVNIVMMNNDDLITDLLQLCETYTSAADSLD